MLSPEPFLPLIDQRIWQRFPDYRALSVVIRGFVPVQPDPVEATPPAPTLPPWTDSSIEAWHTVFRQFGSNPKRTPPSFDALIRRFRKDGALPVISPILDRYNALSVQFAAPFGGEDLEHYSGVPRLVIADGSETFDTVQNGLAVSEHPDPGEIIWRDDIGVTCQRWNWRQCKRTAITDRSVDLWFVIDRLPPLSIGDLERAGDLLVGSLQSISPAITSSVTLLAP
jgi:DNA/RNA-binding domain of Phe-tRNA-synthetase-like protein